MNPSAAQSHRTGGKEDVTGLRIGLAATDRFGQHRDPAAHDHPAFAAPRPIGRRANCREALQVLDGIAVGPPSVPARGVRTPTFWTVSRDNACR